MVAGCRCAVTRDIIERAQLCDAFDQIMVVSDRAELEVDPTVVIEPSSSPFHFGRRLKQVISSHEIEKPFYIGGGSLPLVSSHDLGDIARQLASSGDTVITNNTFSSDLIAFTPGKAIDAIELPATDNLLAQLLARQAGLSPVSLPRTAAYQFDVDTPTDLLCLKLHPNTGRHTQAYLERLDLDTSRLEMAMRLFTDENAQVLVAGRVGSHVWSQLEAKTACRVRMLAEERSMRADERQRRGEVRTILGFYLEQVPMPRFFEALAQLGHAVFIDTRVLFAHMGLHLSASDRFYSDLGQPEKIDNPFAREFTRAAMEAPIPIILGGHSLVCGGLMALTEVACGY